MEYLNSQNSKTAIQSYFIMPCYEQTADCNQRSRHLPPNFAPGLLAVTPTFACPIPHKPPVEPPNLVAITTLLAFGQLSPSSSLQ